MTGAADTGNQVLRVALLTNAPAPYRTEFFNELARLCTLLVVFDTEREPDREWVIETSDFDFDWRISHGLAVSHPHLRRRNFDTHVLHIPLNTFAVLEHFRPDVVVSAELGVRTMWAALYCVAASPTPRRLVGGGPKYRRRQSDSYPETQGSTASGESLLGQRR